MKSFREVFSRRCLVSTATAAAGARLLGAGSPRQDQSRSAAPADNGEVRALALIGDRYHNPDYIRVALDRVFHELRIPIDYTIQYEKLSRDLLKPYRLFICLRDGMIWPGGYLGPDAYAAYEADLENPEQFRKAEPQSWITEEQGAAIKNFVTAGGGFYALHNCSHISLSSKNYREVIGGAYVGHPPLRPFQVRAVNNEHPITRGMKPFIVNDEQHYVDYDKDKNHIILEAENIDGLGYEALGTKSISGWAYEFGSGRVVFTAVGHTIHAMWAPAYLELQKRAVEWLLKKV
jgi:type 1 glutamine amidotransferase